MSQTESYQLFALYLHLKRNSIVSFKKPRVAFAAAVIEEATQQSLFVLSNIYEICNNITISLIKNHRKSILKSHLN